MIAECHQIKGVASVCRVAFPGSGITEFLNGMIQRKEPVKRGEDEFAFIL